MRSVFVATFLVIVLFFGGCQKKSDVYEIRISTNPWVGFTPFMYAQEKGWLKDSKFKFIWVVGLKENAELYEKGLSSGFTVTQYEYFNFKNKEHLKPYFLIDRSDGADIILSNKSISELKNSNEKIDAYFELGSVNNDIFNAFIAENGINKSKFTMQNMDQMLISQLKPKNSPTIVISYEPYATSIKKNGFSKISSTKELRSISVIDAIFIDERVIKGNEKDLNYLHSMFKKAVSSLKSNPKEFYETIKGYLENQTYEQFLSTLEDLKWIDKEEGFKDMEYLQKQGIPTDKLLI